MTTYLLSVVRGSERAVEAELADLGIWARAARVLKPVRRGKRRHTEWHEDHPWSGYMIAKMTPEQFQASVGIEEIYPTRMIVGPLSEKDAMMKLAIADREYEKAERMKSAGEAPPPQYDPGQALRLKSGPFADCVVKFEGLTQRASDLHPFIRADGPLGEMLIDPLNVEAAGSGSV